MRHYRRLAASEIKDLPGEGTAEQLASIAAVHVGTVGGALIVDVLGPDREGLPGSHLATTLQGLPVAVRKHVQEAEWRAKKGGPLERTKRAAVPAGATIVHDHLSPHEWA
jgi:hypothetical protein